jgi:hypothetical protein
MHFNVFQQKWLVDKNQKNDILCHRFSSAIIHV